MPELKQVTKEIKMKPKDDLERDLKSCIEIGDIVTIDDDGSDVDAYVVKSIKNDKMVIICGLQITSAKDNVYVEEITIPTTSLIYIGDSFISINSCLWKVKNKILNNESTNLTFKII